MAVFLENIAKYGDLPFSSQFIFRSQAKKESADKTPIRC